MITFKRYMRLVEAAQQLNGFRVTPLETFVELPGAEIPGKPVVKKMPSSNMTEADGDDQEFGLGASVRPLPPDELNALLGRNKNFQRTKADKFTTPYIHNKIIKVLDTKFQEFDLDALRKLITTRPLHMLKQNEKMQHSDGSAEVYYNIGMPALRGLAVNEKTDEFVVVNTCPGAGGCMIDCYALKGSYVVHKAVGVNLNRMLNFLINDPRGFSRRLSMDITKIEAKWAKTQKSGKTGQVKVKLRWHDAGDFFSPEYKKLAFDVARQHPNVDFYAYSKMAHTMLEEAPPNFIFNFSGGAKPSERSQIDTTKYKNAQIVPKDMFRDLVLRAGAGLKRDAQGQMQYVKPEATSILRLKQRLGQKYSLPLDSILTYSEYMAKSTNSGAEKWNVIVSPGDGDVSASRVDVLGTYLLFH